MNQRGKKSMLYDLIKGIGISNTGRIPNIINSAKPSGIGIILLVKEEKIVILVN